MIWLLDRLYNLHWVGDGAARSAQPYLGFYRPWLAAHGFKSVINLRGENIQRGWWRREKALCQSLGIKHFDVRLSSRRLPLPAMLAALFDAFEQAPLPVLFKCSGGQDRTSFAAALYLLHTRGTGTLQEAEAQFAAWPYLHLPKRHQDWLKLFPRFAVEDADGMGLTEWARTRYSPERLEQWLTKRGLERSHQGIQKPDPERKIGRKPA